MTRLRRLPLPPAALLRPLLVLGVLAGAAPVLSTFQVALLTEVLIFGLAAASLDLLVGYAGMVSLGHILFFGVGGYAAALVMLHATAQTGLVLLTAVALTTGVGLVFGLVAVRVRGIYFLMLTLAFAQLAYSLAQRWRDVTGGDDGLVGIPAAALPMGVDVIGRLPFYYYTLVAVALAYAVLTVLVRSPFGRTLRGIRENEQRMRAVGYPVGRYKLAAYVVAGATAGYAGALFVQFQRFISPANVSFELSALLLIMVIVGGAGTLYGPVLGAGVIVYLRDRLTAGFEHWELALGLVFLLIVYFAPRGVGGMVGDLRDRGLGGRRPWPPRRRAAVPEREEVGS